MVVRKVGTWPDGKQPVVLSLQDPLVGLATDRASPGHPGIRRSHFDLGVPLPRRGRHRSPHQHRHPEGPMLHTLHLMVVDPSTAVSGFDENGDDLITVAVADFRQRRAAADDAPTAQGGRADGKSVTRSMALQWLSIHPCWPAGRGA